jgi:CBS domain-containing protein
MHVNEIMTKKAVCCSRTTSLRNAARMLREFDIGLLPVIDDWSTQKLIGVVTDRDLCLAGLTESHDPLLYTVEDCMTTNVITCTETMDVRAALAAMAENRVRRLPVIGPDNTIRGIVGISDIMRHDAVAYRDICAVLSRIMAPKDRVRTQAA